MSVDPPGARSRRDHLTAGVATCVLAVVVAALWWPRPGDTPRAADGDSPTVHDLRFVGTVTAIGLRRPPDPSTGHRRNWVVTARVEQVLAGTFDGDTFSFVVHSPHLEGLREGGRYVIYADRVSGREFRFFGAKPEE